MSDQAKFQKMLEVLLLMDCQYGRTITELSERFEISQRTVYRYLDTFKQVGFVIENTNGYFKIDKENTTVQEISHLLHFSEEEAFILSKAIHSIEDIDELKSKLVKKLYSLYDFDRVIHAISKKEESENIYTLLQAIKQQKNAFKEGKEGCC
jgi:predicted DNA-binding transcriptional regulator YafY